MRPLQIPAVLACIPWATCSPTPPQDSVGETTVPPGIHLIVTKARGQSGADALRAGILLDLPGDREWTFFAEPASAGGSNEGEPKPRNELWQVRREERDLNEPRSSFLDGTRDQVITTLLLKRTERGWLKLWRDHLSTDRSALPDSTEGGRCWSYAKAIVSSLVETRNLDRNDAKGRWDEILLMSELTTRDEDPAWVVSIPRCRRWPVEHRAESQSPSEIEIEYVDSEPEPEPEPEPGVLLLDHEKDDGGEAKAKEATKKQAKGKAVWATWGAKLRTLWQAISKAKDVEETDGFIARVYLAAADEQAVQAGIIVKVLGDGETTFFPFTTSTDAAQQRMQVEGKRLRPSELASGKAGFMTNPAIRAVPLFSTTSRDSFEHFLQALTNPALRPQDVIDTECWHFAMNAVHVAAQLSLIQGGPAGARHKWGTLLWLVAKDWTRQLWPACREYKFGGSPVPAAEPALAAPVPLRQHAPQAGGFGGFVNGPLIL